MLGIRIMAIGIGQGRENAKTFLKENSNIASEIEESIRVSSQKELIQKMKKQRLTKFKETKGEAEEKKDIEKTE